MSLPSDKLLDDEALAALLSCRLGRARRQSRQCPELAMVSMGVSPDAEPRARACAENHLRACEECSATVAGWRVWVAETVLEPHLIPDTLSPASFVRSPILHWLMPRQWLLAGAAAVLALGLLSPWQSLRFRDETDGQDTLTLKGAAADLLHLAVRRHGEALRLKAGESLQDGDIVGFFYSSPRAGYLVVLGVTQGKGAVVLYPSSGSYSGVVGSGSDVALPTTGVVEQQGQCEWIVGVFSDEPLPLASLRDGATEAARAANAKCNLAWHPASARTVVVLP